MPERTIYDDAAAILTGGGVIAYPTEGVFGLGCLPNIESAALRIAAIKQRGLDDGFILVAASLEQLSPFVAAEQRTLLAKRVARSEKPITWVVDSSSETPEWVTGRRASVAVRVSGHPVVVGLCLAANSALVSTSANRSGQAPVTDPDTLRSDFEAAVDMIVPGEIGSLGGATEIRLASDGSVLRACAARRDMP